MHAQQGFEWSVGPARNIVIHADNGTPITLAVARRPHCSMKKRVLILCTENFCRSQVAEALRRQLAPEE